ncbi:pyridoxal phosphate-dependent transferase [Gamsiella multidivaricata]|uniref:pyridoxal phosphate-dependent transferase n=1 Tax=Gamsiella multidivaricata TaxID=101098 RepID=UPI00221F1D8D|nr:pyridoxal phosphate-dependent transferase [Gamsiella multidivaricata]KAI7830172.1 pyridoxal phosphate-dependent transferase [Gamsiella multidivaricata]
MGKGSRSAVATSPVSFKATPLSSQHHAKFQEALSVKEPKEKLYWKGFSSSSKNRALFKTSYDDIMEEPPYFYLITTYLSYIILSFFGHVRDFYGFRWNKKAYAHLMPSNGYAALTSDWDSFWTRNLKMRIEDCFSVPTTLVPGRTINMLERVTNDYCRTFQFTGRLKEAVNLSSYNYLGFAQSTGPCADAVEEIVHTYGTSSCGTRLESGSLDLHTKTEELVAEFMGKEAALLVSMGYATNSTTIAGLASKGSLIISDELNHNSLVFGSRLSGAYIRVFKHNDTQDLEAVLRDAISQGQPRTHRPWKNILLIVEGLYSMEGSIVKLPEIIELKKKYKFHLYVDEAHSVGAIGPRGRGVCDYYGVDPKEVDILMGTFTKSFGAAGGYICASKEIIDHLRLVNHSSVYGESMSPIVLQQIYTSMWSIMGRDGTNAGQERLSRLAWNARYLGSNLRKMGFIIYGDRDSPVIPLLLFNPAKIPAFSRECRKRDLAVVVVGFPATSIVASRARFCVSASHTKEDLDFVLRVVSEVGDILGLKMSNRQALEMGMEV